ncbi:hypothetical protein LCGC14_1711610 [marine sediment metagenome]|uniref:Uncharacterized protein n=1 Tax=marine sediment metagenome TaxID=412755 RepID=A0A0F9I2I7_9ZZZZ
MNRIKCTFKGHCGNKMEGEYCSNVPSISCSWQEPQPDQDKIECKFEDWDDTVLPRPACHCMKRKDVDCANVPDDVESCPDYEPKPQPDQDEIERDKISKSNAIGMGLIPPDRSRLLTVDQMDKLLYPRGQGKWAVAKAQLAKDEADKVVEVGVAYTAGFNKGLEHSQARIEALIEEIEGKSTHQATNMFGISLDKETWDGIKANHCKANPTSEVEG